MRTVLVVERDPMVAQVMRQLLEDEGYAVLGCREASHCIDSVENGEVDLVIMEILTPTPASARAVISRLRQGERTARVPILVCTVDELWIRQSADWLHLYHVPVLLKPFDIDVFLSSVDAALACASRSVA